MSTGNAVDFGDLTERRNTATCSNAVRGISAAGIPDSGTAGVNTVDFITISTLGDATDFGDTVFARHSICALASSTRAICAGGRSGDSNYNSIDFATIMTTGNYIDFGDLTRISVGGFGLSNGHGGL